MRLQELPRSVENKLDLNSPITTAAMLIGAISARAWIYRSDINGQMNRNFESIWHGTQLQGLAAKCDETIAEVVPETKGKFVNVDLDKMSNEHIANIHSDAPEHIVVTGLNAVGKSTILNSFAGFLEFCEIKSSVIKMPRPDGPLSQVINSALSGDLKIDKDALQLVFLADAIDLKPEPDTLIVFDRHPIAAEAFTYGSPQIARTVLSTQEIKTDVYQTFIIDQHPIACALKRSERETKPRIFEDRVEKMVDQLIRFARLTVLPGTHWINNDIPQNDGVHKNPIHTAIERFIGAVQYNGVLKRHLLKQGRFTSYSQASEFLYTKWLDFEEKLVKSS
jgi:thymidylate kinase